MSEYPRGANEILLERDPCGSLEGITESRIPGREVLSEEEPRATESYTRIERGVRLLDALPDAPSARRS